MSRLRRVAILVSLVLCASAGMQAKTLIRLGLPTDHSRLAIKTMQMELDRIVAGTGLGIEWVSKDAPVVDFRGRTVSIDLRGSCVAAPEHRLLEGPLGWTKIVDGHVLPYVEVDCARIRALITPAWSASDPLERDLLFGRAIARVVAHELAHALTRTRHHEGEVLRKTALSPTDLLFGSYRMTAGDFHRRRPSRPSSLRASWPTPNASTYLDTESR